MTAETKKIITTGLIAGAILLLFSVLGLHVTNWLFPSIAIQYFDPAFDTQSSRIMFYYLHPFVISLVLSWFWTRFRGILTGNFLSRGIEFGLIYVLIATMPMLLLIYSAMNVSITMVTTWFVLALVQGIIAGLVCEKINP